MSADPKTVSILPHPDIFNRALAWAGVKADTLHVYERDGKLHPSNGGVYDTNQILQKLIQAIVEIHLVQTGGRDPRPNGYEHVIGEAELRGKVKHAETRDRSLPDHDDLPEGLHLVETGDPPLDTAIEDAQGWLWVTLHRAGPGDPRKWHRAIRSAVLEALGVKEDI